MKKWSVILGLVIMAGLAFVIFRDRPHQDIAAVTGATPLAVRHSVPGEFSLRVTGRVKQEYFFPAEALDELANTRIRTREFNENGDFLGAYIYIGIPVYNILEGVAPSFPPGSVFDRPLDLLVTFVSASGEESSFSYGELTMTDDRHPVTLAYFREPLMPTKGPEQYTLNLHGESLQGLRLITPREPDVARCLDDVVAIRLEPVTTPDEMLPELAKGSPCRTETLVCIADGREMPAVFDEVGTSRVDRWVRLGHGRGFKEVRAAEGWTLADFLRANFPGCGQWDCFMFVACDGYRAVFSGREIFATGDGQRMIILPPRPDDPEDSGYVLVPAGDFFVDRSLWGLSHVVHLKPGSPRSNS